MSQFVTVDTLQGKLRGWRVTSSSNEVMYYSFQGIPYAKPPVGLLRFKPPEEPEPWTGTRYATKERDVAPQLDMFSGKLVGKEDCLFLNVYTPQWPAISPKAVMVWIHGGAFVQGSGNTDLHGPDFLVAEDVVVVTINYRLGALGFLYLEGTEITGNNGLRDQVMALKWVKNNIAHFGGDPDNVTLFGQSAGGVSVHYLMLSPLAKGLFHRAIAQSGTALYSCSHTPRNVSAQRAIRLAQLLGCTSEDPQDIANFLRTVPAERLVMYQSRVFSEKDKHRILDLAFFACEEVGPEAFLPDSPKNLIHKGLFMKIPFMTGMTSAEGKLGLLDAFCRMKLSELDKYFENVLPPDLVRHVGPAKCEEVGNIVKRFYFGEKRLGDHTISHYIDMMTDLTFTHHIHHTVQSQTKWSPHPTYVYLFDHKSAPGGVGIMPTAADHLPGATHGAELPYLFQSSLKPSKFIPGSPDERVFHKLVKLWAQFAKTGNPSCDAVDVTWIPAVKGKHNYLRINGGFNMDCDMYKQRLDFLDDLYLKYGMRTYIY